MIYDKGWREILDAVQLIGWWWFPIFALAIVWQICHTLGWHTVLGFMGHHLPFLRLFKLKVIAEAVNMVAPSANLGGDVSRAYLIKKNVPLEDGISSIVVDKTLDNITKLLFNSFGLLLTVIFIPIPDVWLWGSVGYLFVVLLFCTALVWVQLKGITGWLLKISNLIPRLKSALVKQEEKLNSLDSNFRGIYSKKGIKDLIIANCWHLVGRTLGTLEIWLVMYLLNAPIGFLEAFYIATIYNIVMGIFFLLPGQWGVLEVTTMYTVELIGFSPELGLSLGVIRRVRRLILTGMGLLFFYFFKEDVPEVLIQQEPIDNLPDSEKVLDTT